MATIDPAMLAAGTEAICEIKAALFKGAGDALVRHGPDPHSAVILAAAVCMFIDTVEKEISPGFRKMVVALLEHQES